MFYVLVRLYFRGPTTVPLDFNAKETFNLVIVDVMLPSTDFRSALHFGPMDKESKKLKRNSSKTLFASKRGGWLF